MSEFRQSIATGEWVIISKERGKRPEDFKGGPKKTEKNLIPEHDPECPFCKGGSSEEYKSLYQVDGEDGWNLRVIPNLFAALHSSHSTKRFRDGFYLKAAGYGHAEVLIETPTHNQTIATMELATIESILHAYKIRYNSLAEDSKLNIINIFRNNGPSAGASLIHPHSQIIGSLVAPPSVCNQMFYAKQSYNTFGDCIYCEIIKEELKQEKRVIFDSKHFLAYCPFASRSPYEIRIIPKKHSSVYGNIDSEVIPDLAHILKTVLSKVYVLLGNPDFNYIIRSITTNDNEVHFYHWYIVIVPRVSKTAGFEIGTQMYINTTEPETCAKELRDTTLSSLI